MVQVLEFLRDRASEGSAPQAPSREGAATVRVTSLQTPLPTMEMLAEVQVEQLDSGQVKVLQKSVKLCLEFLNNITAVNQDTIPSNLRNAVHAAVQKFWHRGLSVEFDRLSKILLACGLETNVDKLVKQLTKEELFKHELAKPYLGALVAKNLQPVHYEKLVASVLQDIQVDDDGENEKMQVSVLTGKSTFVIGRVFSRLDKFDTLDSVLAKYKSENGELYPAALVFLLKIRKWKTAFSTCAFSEETIKQFTLADELNTQ